jgi:hypothetical protein
MFAETRKRNSFCLKESKIFPRSRELPGGKITENHTKMLLNALLCNGDKTYKFPFMAFLLHMRKENY